MTPLFDSHLHIIDPRFPLVANEGFLPEAFRVADYQAQAGAIGVVGGAVVSGSFQAWDQRYLEDALARLGPGFVGVTQLPAETPDEEILHLDRLGLRAVRFNLKRGIHPDRGEMVRLARRVFDLVGWHAELYLDASDLPALGRLPLDLPRIVIDHLGLSRRGLPHLLRLVERGARVKASGFGRVDLPVAETLRTIAGIDPGALLFGTDLPCTRAPRPFSSQDLALVQDALGDDALVRRVLLDNALSLYHPAQSLDA